MVLYFTIYGLTKLCAKAVYVLQYKLVLPEDDYK